MHVLSTSQEENLLDVLQLVLSIMTEQPDTCIPVFDKVDGLRYAVRLSVCLSVRCLSVCLSACWHVCSLSVCLPACRHVCSLSVCVYVCPFVWPTLWLLICVLVCPICLFIRLSFFGRWPWFSSFVSLHQGFVSFPGHEIRGSPSLFLKDYWMLSSVLSSKVSHHSLLTMTITITITSQDWG